MIKMIVSIEFTEDQIADLKGNVDMGIILLSTPFVETINNGKTMILKAIPAHLARMITTKRIESTRSDFIENLPEELIEG